MVCAEFPLSRGFFRLCIELRGLNLTPVWPRDVVSAGRAGSLDPLQNRSNLEVLPGLYACCHQTTCCVSYAPLRLQ